MLFFLGGYPPPLLFNISQLLAGFCNEAMMAYAIVQCQRDSRRSAYEGCIRGALEDARSAFVVSGSARSSVTTCASSPTIMRGWVCFPTSPLTTWLRADETVLTSLFMAMCLRMLSTSWHRCVTRQSPLQNHRTKNLYHIYLENIFLLHLLVWRGGKCPPSLINRID